MIFISPGLYEFEYDKIKAMLISLLLVIVINYYLTNMIVLPTFWNFFFNFQKETGHVPVYFEDKLTEYVNFYIT